MTSSRELRQCLKLCRHCWSTERLCTALICAIVGCA